MIDVLWVTSTLQAERDANHAVVTRMDPLPEPVISWTVSVTVVLDSGEEIVLNARTSHGEIQSRCWDANLVDATSQVLYLPNVTVQQVCASVKTTSWVTTVICVLHARLV